jgi:hypothetical protein
MRRTWVARKRSTTRRTLDRWLATLIHAGRRPSMPIANPARSTQLCADVGTCRTSGDAAGRRRVQLEMRPICSDYPTASYRLHERRAVPCYLSIAYT